MAQQQEQLKNTTFEVMLDTEGMPVHRVTAAYTDAIRIPGWVLLITEDDVIAAKVNSYRVLMIRRADSDPSREPKVQLAFDGPPPASVPMDLITAPHILARFA